MKIKNAPISEPASLPQSGSLPQSVLIRIISENESVFFNHFFCVIRGLAQMPSPILGQITTFRLLLDYISRISRLSPTESRTSSRQMMRPCEEVHVFSDVSSNSEESQQGRGGIRKRLSNAGTQQRGDAEQYTSCTLGNSWPLRVDGRASVYA